MAEALWISYVDSNGSVTSMSAEGSYLQSKVRFHATSEGYMSLMLQASFGDPALRYTENTRCLSRVARRYLDIKQYVP